MPALLSAFDNWFFLLNAITGVLFLIAGVYFTVKPEKSAFLISNFAYRSKEERERYDLIALGRHLCRMLTTCAVVCLAGAVTSLALGAAAYWAATLGWIVLAVLSLRVDNEKLLRKYRKD